ncbi:11101_t:CDS:2 [Entrophospora sp. SA101]|nr:11101_t:CDS:2 [Entrophospora sp. SA101]
MLKDGTDMIKKSSEETMKAMKVICWRCNHLVVRRNDGSGGGGRGSNHGNLIKPLDSFNYAFDVCTNDYIASLYQKRATVEQLCSSDTRNTYLALSSAAKKDITKIEIYSLQSNELRPTISVFKNFV